MTEEITITNRYLMTVETDSEDGKAHTRTVTMLDKQTGISITVPKVTREPFQTKRMLMAALKDLHGKLVVWDK